MNVSFFWEQDTRASEKGGKYMNCVTVSNVVRGLATGGAHAARRETLSQSEASTDGCPGWEREIWRSLIITSKC